MRQGGREDWGIKFIETAGKTIEKVLAKTDPFKGIICNEGVGCLASHNKKNKIGCRKNNIGYKISIKKMPRGVYW